MYGPGDNYDLENSHFYPALINKITTAKKEKKKYLTLWGSGNALRELMFVEDFADALIYFMNKDIKEPFLNIGTGKSYSIKWYTKFLMKKIGVNLKIKFDKSKPDGTPEKCLESTLVLELLAEMAYNTLVLGGAGIKLPDHILHKHYDRKHGSKKYYGQ